MSKRVPDEFKMQFVEGLNSKLKAKNITAYALAKRLGISYQTAYGWTRGRILPTVHRLRVLAIVLDTTIDELIPENNKWDKELTRSTSSDG